MHVLDTDGTDSIGISSQRLSKLDLSSNRLVRLEDAAFATLPNLSVLDLSDNGKFEFYCCATSRLTFLTLDS